MVLKVPLDKIWPTGHRWLVVLHMDHLLEIKSNVRLMLLLSCAISWGYCISWLLDIVQLTCFTVAPWKEEGIGKWSCIVYLFGGIALAFMGQHSAMALAYYDEGGEELRERKERYLNEMQKQTADVLTRATGQAQKLCGLLSTDLGEKVNEHVFRMRTILQKIEKDRNPQAKRIYDDLVFQMASHLHSLRQPAMTHFETLIKLSGQTYILECALKQLRHESMVQLLTGKTSGVPRTSTVHSDTEEGVMGMLDGVIGQHRSLHDALCCGCCHPGPAQVSGPQALQRATSVDTYFTVPNEHDMQEQLRPLTVEEQKKQPEKVVLQPLHLVLRWFEKIAPKQQPEATSTLRPRPGSASPLSPVMEEARDAAGQVREVVRHLRRSPFYRCLLLGICCSIALFCFYAHMLGVCFDVMKKGECHGQLIFACFFALMRKLFGMCAMVCYAGSLGVVLWNVDRLDSVLQVQDEIHELEDFKRQIDQLNAHDLAEEESGVSIIQNVEKALAQQKMLVAAFFNSCWGESVPLSEFEHLAQDLETALHPNRRRGLGGGCLGGGSSTRTPGAYTQAPQACSDEESSRLTDVG